MKQVNILKQKVNVYFCCKLSMATITYSTFILIYFCYKVCKNIQIKTIHNFILYCDQIVNLAKKIT